QPGCKEGPVGVRPWGAFVEGGRRVCWPGGPEPRGTRAEIEVAGLAEITPPWIGVVFGGRFIQNQHLAIHAAAIGANATQRSRPGTSGRLAVSPIHEGLGIGGGRCVVERETRLGIERVVGR